MGSTITPNFDISRKQIADFVKDPRTIRDVEALARMLREQVPTALTGKVDDTRILIAGAGLTGGGPLSADVTFDVGAGTGMIINADDIAIDLVAEAERIRDVIGTALTDTATIDFTADDAADTIKADLKNTTVTPGVYTSANITVDAQGRITAAANGSLAAGSVGATELSSTTVTPGSYTNTNLTVDADGRLTAASNGSAGGGGTIYASNNITTVNSGLFAGRGVLLVPFAPFTMTKAFFLVTPPSNTATYTCYVVTVDASNVVLTVASGANSITPGSTAVGQMMLFTLTAPVSLVAGTRYGLLCYRTDSIGAATSGTYSGTSDAATSPVIPLATFLRQTTLLPTVGDTLASGSNPYYHGYTVT